MADIAGAFERASELKHLDLDIRSFIDTITNLKRNYNIKLRLVSAFTSSMSQKDLDRLRMFMKEAYTLTKLDANEISLIESKMSLMLRKLEILSMTEKVAGREEAEADAYQNLLRFKEELENLGKVIVAQLRVLEETSGSLILQKQRHEEFLQNMRQEAEIIQAGTNELKAIESLLQQASRFKEVDLAISRLKEIPISVIIPAHNEEDYIKKTLQSIKKQNYHAYEIIVICDDCQDSTPIIAQEFNAIIVNVKKGKVAAVRNEGAKRAKGLILVFNDADTIMSPNYLSEANNAVKEGYIFGSARMAAETRHPLGMLSTMILNYYSSVRHYSHGNCFVRKDAFFHAGGYNESLDVGEDTDLAERLKKTGPFKYLSTAFLVHCERKFREKGYFKEFLRMGVEGLTYLHARNKYMKKHLK